MFHEYFKLMSPKYYSILKFHLLNGWCCKLILYDSEQKPYRQHHQHHQGTEENVDKKIAEWRKKYKSLTELKR